MSRVNAAAELPAAWRAASALDPVVIAERWITGGEYTVAVLQGEALPAIRIETPRAFYDYQAKYFADDTRYLIPCGLAPDAESELQAHGARHVRRDRRLRLGPRRLRHGRRTAGRCCSRSTPCPA